MMKNILFPCILLAVGGSTIRLLLGALGKEALGNFFRNVLGLVILLVLCTGILGQWQVPPKITYESTANYEVIYNSNLQNALSAAEEQLAAQICELIEKEFGVRPFQCQVTLAADSFSVRKIFVQFQVGTPISGYALKQSIAEYGGEVEVDFFA